MTNPSSNGGGVRLTKIEAELVETTVRDHPERMVAVVEAILINRRFHRLHPVVAERRLQRDLSGPSPPDASSAGPPRASGGDGG